MRPREDAAIERLASLGGSDLVVTLVALYLEQTNDRIAAARIAARERDVDRLGQLAHAIRSSSAQLGAEDVVAACEAIEDAGDRGDPAGAVERLQELEARLEAFATRLTARFPGPSSPVATEARGPRESTDGVRPRIAVIEDNADNRLLVDAILGDRFTLDEYGSGAEALAGMVTQRPDLVLLDVSLPGMDGLEVLARLRADPRLRGVPVVALTAHAMAGDRERYLAAGFDAYVPKPIVDDQVLIETVGALVTPRVTGPEDHGR